MLWIFKLFQPAKPAASKPAPVLAPKDEPDDGVDLFASDSEDEEAAKIKEERLAAYAAKKSKSLYKYKLCIIFTWSSYIFHRVFNF